MRRIAIVFPGQASQFTGMGRAFYDSAPEARAAFDLADERLGMKISTLCFEGSDADLSMTENTQPAILTVSVAAWRLFSERLPGDVRIHAMAGHSLGEYSALVATGVLDFGDAVELVRKRGRYMQEAVPVGAGAMAAILGMDVKAVTELCREAARGDVVVPANYNSPDQTVVAGHADAVRRAIALAGARGAKRAIMLPVSAPFHSPMMAPAKERLDVDLNKVAMAEPTTPVVCNVDASYIDVAERARDALSRQMTASVRWTESIERLTADGVNTFVEVGPGKVLLGLIRRISRGCELYNVDGPKTLETTLASLGSAS